MPTATQSNLTGKLIAFLGPSNDKPAKIAVQPEGTTDESNVLWIPIWGNEEKQILADSSDGEDIVNLPITSKPKGKYVNVSIFLGPPADRLAAFLAS